MTVLSEGAWTLEIPDGAHGVKFDELVAAEGLSHCMKAVDFVVERSSRLLFIELKDPLSGPRDQYRRFREDLSRQRLDEDLYRKFRDTFLYHWGHDRIPPQGSVEYYIIVVLAEPDKPLLIALTDALRRKLPLVPNWPRPLARTCLALAPGDWSRLFPDMPVQSTHPST